MLCGFMWAGANVVVGDNPIIPGQGVCDPHIRIYDNKAYLYASHDTGPGFSDYTMEDWQLFSSIDLVTWKKEFVLRPEDTFIGKYSKCYAPDGISRNGKYYFYFSENQKQTGVAVSDKPEGPYVDALGKPLLPHDLTPTADYDKAIFIDDDPEQTPYIVWGFTVLGQDYYIARLNEDMISLAEEPRKIVIHQGWHNDAPALHKHNGIYYLNSHGANYATSTNVYGPYTFRGLYTSEWSDHGSFFEWNNQHFHTYGVRVDPDDQFYRTTKITYAYYKDNGGIRTDDFIGSSPLGVGQYDAAWCRIQGEWYFAASDGLETREHADGFEVRGIQNGSWLLYPKVKNMSKNTTLSFHVSAANPSGGIIEVREGNASGSLLGKSVVAATERWDQYQTVHIPLKNTSGTHDLYFLFKGEGAELLRLDWWNTDQATIAYKGENSRLPGRIQVEDYDNGGYHEMTPQQHGGAYRLDTPVDIGAIPETRDEYFVGWFDAGEWMEYSVDCAGGTYNLNLRVAYPMDDKMVKIELDGKTIAIVDVPNTGDFQTWQVVTVPCIVLPETNGGVLRISSIHGGPNLDWIQFD